MSGLPQKKIYGAGMKSLALAVVKPGCPACEDTKPQISKARLRVVNVDDHPSAVEHLGVEAFPDVIYKNSKGVVHHMPWPSKGMPTAAEIVAWIDSMKAGKKNTVSSKSNANRCTDCDGVSTSVWGPPLWFVIHMAALMQPRKLNATQRRRMHLFFKELQPVLPCARCREHYLAELRSMDPGVFRSRDALFAWTVDFHNRVSDRTGSAQPRHGVPHWKKYYKAIALRAVQQHGLKMGAPPLG